MSKPMSPAARLYQEAFTKAAGEAAARAELAGVEPVGLKKAEPDAGLVTIDFDVAVSAPIARNKKRPETLGRR